MTPAYRPMLATLIDKPFDDKGWVFETKWDGFRLTSNLSGLRSFARQKTKISLCDLRKTPRSSA